MHVVAMLAVCCAQMALAFCPPGASLPLAQARARAMLRPSMALQAPSVGLAAKGAVALPVAAAQASILVLPEIFSSAHLLSSPIPADSGLPAVALILLRTAYRCSHGYTIYLGGVLLISLRRARPAL